MFTLLLPGKNCTVVPLTPCYWYGGRCTTEETCPRGEYELNGGCSSKMCKCCVENTVCNIDCSRKFYVLCAYSTQRMKLNYLILQIDDKEE